MGIRKISPFTSKTTMKKGRVNPVPSLKTFRSYFVTQAPIALRISFAWVSVFTVV